MGMTRTANAQPTTPQTVARVDLDRYMGTWYEITRLPMFFQRHCASDVTANYSQQPNGAIKVDNQCKQKDGKVIQSIGQATQNGASENLSFEEELAQDVLETDERHQTHPISLYVRSYQM
ncbi:hypothetical protein A9306_06405 [Moraxella atlantae]|uniref:Lipocalin/cytosolic fatty-acid binding domain-containing protein n=2 Tax=Faucicola atlantae TaxID=34059 RepID=A0A1B8QGN4_9GAMM|nr:hypothetical protein A9306_06405 [Moraxella atlantae]